MYDKEHKFVNERMEIQQVDEVIWIALNITKMFDLGFGRMLIEILSQPYWV